jgi:hypothetical protein
MPLNETRGDLMRRLIAQRLDEMRRRPTLSRQGAIRKARADYEQIRREDLDIPVYSALWKQAVADVLSADNLIQDMRRRRAIACLSV